LKYLADFQISKWYPSSYNCIFQKNSSRYWRRPYFSKKTLLAVGEDRIFQKKLFSLLAKTIFFKKSSSRYWRRLYFSKKALLAISEDRIFQKKMK
jgi:hypothetical protein